MVCELWGTTIPVRQICEQIMNVNLPRAAITYYFYVHFVINLNIDRSHQTFLFSNICPSVIPKQLNISV